MNMANPSFIQYYSEKIGKPIAAFTKADWRKVAMTASEFLDRAFDKLHPPHKQPGRPRKKRSLADSIPKPKKKVGRPKTKYYGRSPSSINAMIEDHLRSPEARKKWPDATRTKKKVLKILLSSLGKTHGGSYDPAAVERAIRREKADKIKNKC